MNFLNLGNRTTSSGSEPAADVAQPAVLPQPIQLKYSLDKELVDKINSIEKRLFKQNFSYSSCVWEKIDSSKEPANQNSPSPSSTDGNNQGDGEANDANEDIKEAKHSTNKADVGSAGNPRENSQNGFVNGSANRANDGEQNHNVSSQNPQAAQQSNVALQEAEVLNNNQDRESADGRINEDADDEIRNDSCSGSFSQLMASGSSSNSTTKAKYLSQTFEQRTPNNNEFVTFYPKPKPNSKLFFGGSNFYVCFRFYYTMFERLLKAYELAKDIPENEITAKMSPEDKHELAEERYDTFKEILKLYLKEPFDGATFEDCLRCIYGRDAGFLFSIDKIVNNIIKNIPGSNDDLSAFVLENSKDLFDLALPDENSDVPEIIKYASVCQKLREMQEQKGSKTNQSSASTNNSANVMRYYYDPDRRLIHINIAQSLYHKWNQKSVRVAKKHFDLLSLDKRHHSSLPQPTLDHTRSAQRPSSHINSVVSQTHPVNRTHAWEAIVYMTRNRNKSQLVGLSPKEVFVRNRVSYKV